MDARKNIYFYIVFLFMLCSFYICNGFSVNAQVPQEINIEYLKNKENEYVDYLFTTKEVSLSKITDSSITITSENFNKDFLENAKSLKNTFGYDVNYENGELIVSGLIPDFLYNSLYIEAESFNNEKYVLEIKNFKTAKSQDLIKQFVTQTLQYTIKKSILPIDFYMWEHKILMKEVTPEEFIFRVLQHPKILYNTDTPEKFIEKAYSAIFLDHISRDELINWLNKFNEYKQKYFMKDDEVWTLIIEEMIQSEDFKNRIELLNIDELEVPLSTRYSEVYENSKFDYKIDNEIKNLYVMDYNELNRTKMNETGAVLFLNEGFRYVLNSNSKIFVDIENATAKYKDGKIIIEGLQPNTVYKNFKIVYTNRGLEKIIFVERIKTTRTKEQKLLKSDKVDRKFNVLDSFGYSIDDFLKIFYEKKYGLEIKEDELDCLKLLFVVDRVKLEKFLNLVYKSDFNIDNKILISKLYDVIFNRSADIEGLKYWVEKFEIYEGFMSNSYEIVKKIILEMMDSDEFKNRFNDAVLKNIIEFNNRDKKLHIV